MATWIRVFCPNTTLRCRKMPKCFRLANNAYVNVSAVTLPLSAVLAGDPKHVGFAAVVGIAGGDEK